ncbi:MAG: Tetratricopeptide repeat protein [Syntrophaceae bacterium PtaU1.Bin231]|nr:MAG: Tetratricopeptide repeat protein [Syntrophaceae bacterium PtaU1.Bin231]HOG16802.1 tetratricopeptide repeat protein [Syntrophales bacterium]
MSEVINRDVPAAILKKLNDCQAHLQKGNVYACILRLKDLLERLISTPMIPADKRDVTDAVNAFQKRMSESKAFLDIYGPVTFRDGEIDTLYDFVKQLITIKEEEILAVVKEEGQKNDALAAEAATRAEERERLLAEARRLLDAGQFDEARASIGDNDEVITLLVKEYNGAGIACRRRKEYDAAVAAFKKAIAVYGKDEGLHYNLARAYIEQDNWPLARDAIGEALKLNPDFQEGRKLFRFIEERKK